MIQQKITRHFLRQYRHFVPHHDEQGQHRRASALALPALFLYLQILVVLTAGLYLIRLKAPHILGTAQFTAEQIIALTNAAREKNDLPPLAFNNSLSQAAGAKAGDMFELDYWAHNSPIGDTPWSFITRMGYRYIFAGENLARDFSDANSVVDAWMNSPSHRSNLLDKNFKEIGVAVVNGKYGGRESTLVVQMFGTAVSAAPAAAPLAQTPGEGLGQQIKSSPAVVIQTPITPQGAAVIVAGPAEVTVLATKQFSIAKGTALGLVSFIFLLFALEIVVTLKRVDVRLRSGIIAHLALLAFVLFAVWYAAAGAII